MKAEGAFDHWAMKGDEGEDIAWIEFDWDVVGNAPRLARQFAASDLLVEACKADDNYFLHTKGCITCKNYGPCEIGTRLKSVARPLRRTALAAVEGDE